MSTHSLSPEQEVEATLFAERLRELMNEESLALARLLVSKKDSELLGRTEFEMRDRLHELGAKILETALNERKKGGTKGRA